MGSRYGLAKGVALASVVAGPLFVSLLVLFGYEDAAPASFPVGAGDLAQVTYGFAFVIPMSMIVGIVLAFPTCLIAGVVLRFIADRISIARSPVFWIGIGAGLAFGILERGFDGAGAVETYAFLGTAMACAGIVRSRLVWE